MPVTLHKRWSFPLGISSVNATKLVIFTGEVLNGKLFLWNIPSVTKHPIQKQTFKGNLEKSCSEHFGKTQKAVCDEYIFSELVRFRLYLNWVLECCYAFFQNL